MLGRFSAGHPLRTAPVADRRPSAAHRARRRRARPPNRDGQGAGVGVKQTAALVGAARRRDIVVGERVALAVEVGGVEEARVVVRDCVRIVVGNDLALGLVRVNQEGGPIEGRRQARPDGTHLRGGGGEGAGTAGEYVGARGLRKAADVAAETEDIVCDRPGDIAPGRLGIHRQVCGGVLAVDLVHVGVIVGGEVGAVHGDAAVRRQSTKVGPRRVRDYQIGPVAAIAGSLAREPRANRRQSVCGQSLDCGSRAGCVCQSQANGQGHEINVGDVDIKLGTVEGKFTKVPVVVVVGIRFVRHW